MCGTTDTGGALVRLHEGTAPRARGRPTWRNERDGVIRSSPACAGNDLNIIPAGHAQKGSSLACAGRPMTPLVMMCIIRNSPAYAWTTAVACPATRSPWEQPACAGATCGCWPSTAARTEQPRVRGDYLDRRDLPDCWPGNSLAYGETTCCQVRASSLWREQPRHAQGQLEPLEAEVADPWISPACTGMTTSRCRRIRGCRDQPRMRGNDRLTSAELMGTLGTAPGDDRVRNEGAATVLGTAPAFAGTTFRPAPPTEGSSE